MNKQDHRRDLYYKRKYGISLAEYNELDRKQGHKCAICSRPPKKLPLALDHWHKLEKLKIKSVKLKTVWKAYNIAFDLLGYKLKEGKCSFRSHNRKKAVKMVRLMLKR